MKENIIQTPVLIIGTGIAGLTAADNLGAQGIEVTIVTKSHDPKDTNTVKAQGGINGIGRSDDSPDLLSKNTLTAGAGRCGKRAVEILSQQAEPYIDYLVREVGVQFASDQTREGGHDAFRTWHVADETGKAIELALLKKVVDNPRIHILTDMTAVDLLTSWHHSTDFQASYEPNFCAGAYLLNKKTGEITKALAKHTILATGGAGQIFKRTSNPEGATGDGVAMAHRAGVAVDNLEYVQFHPTTLAISGAPSLLITEAARGEGGELVDQKGREFMKDYDERGSRATRDIVSRALRDMMIKNDMPHMYLNLHSYMTRDKILEHFPMIYTECLKYGVDITKDNIPVAPAAHFMCGGIWTDAETGATTLKNLWAAGETATNGGIHGANRLASNSLVAGGIWGEIVARQIVAGIKTTGMPKNDEIKSWTYHSRKPVDAGVIQMYLDIIRSIMWTEVGLVRDYDGLKNARRTISGIERTIENDLYHDGPISDQLVTLRNIALVAQLTAEAAWENKISAGCHYRSS
ncbi:hypothetical protein A2872_00480 [Candidatus Gottesmanbacteria bacterium RIFCSPHIGHO2_01_FULL_42_12]|uniref:L-aspartate oxidase n=1 Tax=Candidatus Gottesmanbacteria bacterium RIFCSPHIGHO2_01_FULL_42_12 TaxID=1798377 RepID=A0A1F5Z313_9BACT|nr:MAG: hypothetical protein A2872_00480 [Candidatus Gottesmanbacteria bacterium RIFCSPHIGHO2_01_FULL_42_12]